MAIENLSGARWRWIILAGALVSGPMLAQSTDADIEAVQRKLDAAKKAQVEREAAQLANAAAQAKMGTLVIKADRDCELSVNGASKGKLRAEQTASVDVKSGEQLIECVADDRQRVEVTERVPLGEQVVVRLKLRPPEESMEFKVERRERISQLLDLVESGSFAGAKEEISTWPVNSLGLEKDRKGFEELIALVESGRSSERNLLGDFDFSGIEALKVRVESLVGSTTDITLRDLAPYGLSPPTEFMQFLNGPGKHLRLAIRGVSEVRVDSEEYIRSGLDPCEVNAAGSPSWVGFPPSGRINKRIVTKPVKGMLVSTISMEMENCHRMYERSLRSIVPKITARRSETTMITSGFGGAYFSLFRDLTDGTVLTTAHRSPTVVSDSAGGFNATWSQIILDSSYKYELQCRPFASVSHPLIGRPMSTFQCSSVESGPTVRNTNDYTLSFFVDYGLPDYLASTWESSMRSSLQKVVGTIGEPGVSQRLIAGPTSIGEGVADPTWEFERSISHSVRGADGKVYPSVRAERVTVTFVTKGL
jgi:hypothetical protein